MLPIILSHGRGLVAGNPIADEVQLAEFVKRECGADGYRIVGDLLLALRWDLEGNEIIVDRFALAVRDA